MHLAIRQLHAAIVFGISIAQVIARFPAMLRTMLDPPRKRKPKLASIKS